MPAADPPPLTSRRARYDSDDAPRGGCRRDFGTALLVAVAGAALVWAVALLLAAR